MKYRTAQWFCDLQMEKYYYRFNVNQAAEIFSESYFQELYQKCLAEDILGHKEYCEEANEPYSEQDAVSEFERRYQNELEVARENIPAEILSKVEDIRVLALWEISAEIKDLLVAYCEELEQKNERANQAYFVHYESIKESLPDGLKKMMLSDCEVIDAIMTEKDYILRIDSRYGYIDCNRVSFKNVRFVKSGNLCDSEWLYDEIYPVQGGFEIHVLLAAKSQDALLEIVFITDDVEIE